MKNLRSRKDTTPIENLQEEPVLFLTQKMGSGWLRIFRMTLNKNAHMRGMKEKTTGRFLSSIYGWLIHKCSYSSPRVTYDNVSYRDC